MSSTDNSSQKISRWQFWIDRGGTFTDVVARRPDGRVVTHKLLSENPERYPDAALEAIRILMDVPVGQAIPHRDVEAVRMGTTVATNALLERKGERTLLVTTQGFGDALRIGYQNRMHLFDLKIVLPEMLYEQVVEVPERVGARGEMLLALDEAAAQTALKGAFEAGIRSVAILFMHGYRFPAHEQAVARLARQMGFTQVSTSHETIPLMKLVSRGDTTVADAYLSPILRRYVDQVASKLGDARLMFMQSNGGLTDAGLFQGKDAILSGPAGGVVGMVNTASMAGFKELIGFDMGGTSTDVSHYNGELERAFETVVAGVRLRAPMMQIHTVAAGGGSILRFEHNRVRVGPESAGANPGPACYRRGGPLTVTDCNVMLGKIQPQYFPHVFGPEGDQPLDREGVKEKFALLTDEINGARGKGTGLQDPEVPQGPETPQGSEETVEGVAEGFLRVAVENMANAIKKISVQRGYDVTGYTLCCFGGAGGQHACAVADALGMKRVYIHPFAGVLSAYGMGLADLRAMREKAVEAPLHVETTEKLALLFEELAASALDELIRQGVPKEDVTLFRKAHLRYAGTDTPLMVDAGTGTPEMTQMVERFESLHRQQFGFIIQGREMVVEAISVEAAGGGSLLEEPMLERPAQASAPEPMETVQIFTEGAWHSAPVFDREKLHPGDLVNGTAILMETNATTVLEPGWMAEVTPRNHLVLTRVTEKQRPHSLGTTADPVMLEIFNNLFMSIAEQMGVTLANTAYSVNIKERLDFSCAVFNRDGNLVANAPHMPVHLGSMGESVRAVAEKHKTTMKPGDVYLLNAPFNGGTHLPDVTVITPVFDDLGKEILFFVASRGHHADIGGITPGSMPPGSTSVEEEGVLFDGERLVSEGVFLEEEITAMLLSGPFPARNPTQNIADLRAQVAANEKGVSELLKMVGHFSLEVVQAYMGHVQDNAEESVRQVLDQLDSGSFTYEMDDGHLICVRVEVHPQTRSATVDFSGTSPQLKNNFNAPSAVCRAAVLYVFRTLVPDDIPMNEGCMKPLNLIIPEGSLLKPVYPAAVVAGNVETSQAIVDALYGALGVMAAAQGTMNNLTFGNERYQYYETLCGGSGAGPGFAGTDAVHTHMTNSRLTDPEVLEWRFPVVLESFSIRRGSGGKGKWPGGNGAVRRIRFLEAMTTGILSSRRRLPPYGMKGGEAGALGLNHVLRANGLKENLKGTDMREMKPGDILIIETPGGGGFGSS